MWAYYLNSYWYFLKNYTSNSFYRTNVGVLFRSLRLSAYSKLTTQLHKLSHVKSRFKSLGRLEYRGFRDNHFDYLDDSQLNLPKPSLTMYTLFLTVSTQNLKLHSRVHPSARSYFMDQRSASSSIFNPTKLFRRWQDFFHLMFNLFFYKIDMLYFGNKVFKKQVLALNWLALTRVRYIWSYMHPYLYHRPTAMDAQLGWMFQYLASLNFNIAFVFDSTYHKITVNYLHKWGFYTIGSVSITHNLRGINFALPVASDSLVMHLFCLRFVCYLKRFAEGRHFTEYRNYWSLR